MTETFKVAGVTKYEDNIRQLADENDEYDYSNQELKEYFDDGDRINEFDFDLTMLDVKLIPEPDNFYDPNAVRVEIDGLTVGYIKKGSCSRVKNLMASSDYFGVEIKSMGVGRYKTLYEDEDGELHVERGCYPHCWVHLSVTAFPSHKSESPKCATQDAPEPKPSSDGTPAPSPTPATPDPSKFVPFSSLETAKKTIPDATQQVNTSPRFDSRKLNNKPSQKGKSSDKSSLVLGIILYTFGLLALAGSALSGFVFCVVAIGLFWDRIKRANPDKPQKIPVWLIVLIVIAFVLLASAAGRSNSKAKMEAPSVGVSETQ